MDRKLVQHTDGVTNIDTGDAGAVRHRMTEESKAFSPEGDTNFQRYDCVAPCRPLGYQYQEIQSNRCLTAPAINMTPSGLVKNATSKRVSETA